MIFFLNRGLILEQEVVRALKEYFIAIDVPGLYRNFSVSVTCEHPFARLMLSASPESEARSLFPVVVVTTEEDSKPDQLSGLSEAAAFALEPEDLAPGKDGAPSPVERRYDMIAPGMLDSLRAAMAASAEGRLYGASRLIRRRDRISIEIWAENPQLKNEIYEIVRLFVMGHMGEALAAHYRRHFEELAEGESPLAIFDGSVGGQRGGNFCADFGAPLHGARIFFDAEYAIEQAAIDTEIAGAKYFEAEATNHVKGIEGAAGVRVAAGLFGGRGQGPGGIEGRGGSDGRDDEAAGGRSGD
ncbi:MAG: hypothetical protein FWE09_00080 [Treponema sp.]|nr:hypothetical protein [Treponema sp.]